MIDGFIGFFAMVYASTFSPSGYTYSEGYYVGQITEIEQRGYIWKTWEGTIRTTKNRTKEMAMKYKIIDCAAPEYFSIDDISVLNMIKKAMIEEKPVILSFKKTAYFMSYWHGETKTFATGIQEIK